MIELLVVVLIIGILAAVALPQYQKAVRKTRAMNVFPILAATLEAGQVYALEHPEITSWNSLVKNFDIGVNIDESGYFPAGECPFSDSNYSDYCNLQFYPVEIGGKEEYEAQFAAEGSGGAMTFILTSTGKRLCSSPTDSCPDYGFTTFNEADQDWDMYDVYSL